MADEKNKRVALEEPKENGSQHVSNSIALDDEQRIKVLSPSMLVFKRFIRNRLAITGAVIIIAMFVFAFIGGLVMPYDESQVFTKFVGMEKDYAGVAVNQDLKFTVAEGYSFASIAQSQFVLAKNTGKTEFKAGDITYNLEKVNDELYFVNQLSEIAKVSTIGKAVSITLGTSAPTDAAFSESLTQAVLAKSAVFESNGARYALVYDRKTVQVCVPTPVAFASPNIFDFATPEGDLGFVFRESAERALVEGANSFTVNGQSFTLRQEGDMAGIYDAAGNDYATISRYVIQPTYNDVFLTLEFKSAVREAVESNSPSFTFTGADGKASEHSIERKNNQWLVKWVESRQVIDDYASPSATHPLGTDGNGMDLLTRIMYGGRISLMIGFIVVFIETMLGVILGGVAGYFGKWIDNLIMRIVDIFNCIPSTPLIIILGAVMDGLRVDPQIRMIYLMLVLGILGWPGVARMVRGQILSLREQEFMVATEATGLPVERRIFRHLVPNVIPQLVVICTMSLGGVILTESTLSFLGLGVKFPFASWGNIINAVSNVHVMTNYWFVWIPAGMCILITVLGFNFIGDGLRDAFDPKMKR